MTLWRRFRPIVLLRTRLRVIDLLTFVTRISWGGASSEAIIFYLTMWHTFETFELIFVVPD